MHIHRPRNRGQAIIKDLHEVIVTEGVRYKTKWDGEFQNSANKDEKVSI